MPKLMSTEDMDKIQIPGPGNFTFSAIRPEKLGASEYTLVSVIVDESGSTYSFSNDLLNTLKSVICACRKSPRAENLMVRVVAFNNSVREIHGFRPLNDINENDYQEFNCGNMTALYDVTYNAIAATTLYAKTLTDQDFNVNGAVYIITDGMDNESLYAPKNIKDVLSKAIQNEEIESITSVLVGLSDNIANVAQGLKMLKDEAGLTQYVSLGDVTPGKLAKLAAFVSKSVSSQSQALGTGGASQPQSLSF